MATQKDGGLVSRAVREALGTLVSPQIYSQLIARSLKVAGLDSIPESGRALASWIQGPLDREIDAVVGPDAAELVAAQLSPIVAHASVPTPVPPAPSPESPRSPAEPHAESGRDRFGSEQPTGMVGAAKARDARPDLVRTARLKVTREQLAQLQGDAGHTSRPQAQEAAGRTPESLTHVLTASASAASIDALAKYLSGTGKVQPVRDLVGLLDLLDGTGLREPIVLLDCQRPTVHVTSIAAIGEDLPRGTTIVLWGVSDDTWAQLDRDRIPSCRWVRCSHEATTDDVGSLCAMLIGSLGRS